MANVRELIDKAGCAERSAALLLESNDTAGACNRAYYAMFDAARAASLATGASQGSARTHGGSIASFGLHLVKTGRIDRSLGHVLNRAHEIRLIADYTGDLVDREPAAWVVQRSALFVSAMRDFVESQP